MTDNNALGHECDDDEYFIHVPQDSAQISHFVQYRTKDNAAVPLVFESLLGEITHDI